MPAHAMAFKRSIQRQSHNLPRISTRELVGILKLLSVADNAKPRAYRLRSRPIAVIRFLLSSVSTGIDRCDIGLGDSKDPWHVYYMSR